jgi:hypothetical protein
MRAGDGRRKGGLAQRKRDCGEKREASCAVPWTEQREGEVGGDPGSENGLHREQDDPLEGFAGVGMLAVRARMAGCCV